jgi:hypothetical protein
MGRQSEQFEQEAEQTRAQLAVTLAELRARMTPGQVIDSVVDYASEGPAAEFLNNLGREIRENPLPLVLIGIGIAWLMVASSRSSRATIASTANLATRKAAEIGEATSAIVSSTSEWGQQTAARMADRVSEVTSRVADSTRDVTGAIADKVRPLTSIPTDASVPLVGKSGPVAASWEARAEADEPQRGGGSITCEDSAVQPKTHWERAPGVEPKHERR